jgi:hypothetical protein
MGENKSVHGRNSAEIRWRALIVILAFPVVQQDDTGAQDRDQWRTAKTKKN